ncbi:hypothetical protein H696_05798 [Fonticula alba]|uniref:Structure-specific endonuclease subunit SLX4 n=1 Tax=Fonticula alba TaxID=691883 RepID=A0A058Z169_FONAL|nr:hypothetical protein H696_05798 [Fonticula alba]KCV67688.1 hypothetical protein H696_05798 [Fonticula alba]|eukprot:XP_009497872.1 hypothetical protein H696_05798 [Fonticula alba]
MPAAPGGSGDGQIACPICARDFPQGQIEAHASSCGLNASPHVSPSRPGRQPIAAACPSSPVPASAGTREECLLCCQPLEPGSLRTHLATSACPQAGTSLGRAILAQVAPLSADAADFVDTPDAASPEQLVQSTLDWVSDFMARSGGVSIGRGRGRRARAAGPLAGALRTQLLVDQENSNLRAALSDSAITSSRETEERRSFRARPGLLAGRRLGISPSEARLLARLHTDGRVGRAPGFGLCAKSRVLCCRAGPSRPLVAAPLPSVVWSRAPSFSALGRQSRAPVDLPPLGPRPPADWPPSRLAQLARAGPNSLGPTVPDASHPPYCIPDLAPFVRGEAPPPAPCPFLLPQPLPGSDGQVPSAEQLRGYISASIWHFQRRLHYALSDAITEYESQVRELGRFLYHPASFLNFAEGMEDGAWREAYPLPASFLGGLDAVALPRAETPASRPSATRPPLSSAVVPPLDGMVLGRDMAPPAGTSAGMSPTPEPSSSPSSPSASSPSSPSPSTLALPVEEIAPSMASMAAPLPDVQHPTAFDALHDDLLFESDDPLDLEHLQFIHDSQTSLAELRAASTDRPPRVRPLTEAPTALSPPGNPPESVPCSHAPAMASALESLPTRTTRPAGVPAEAPSSQTPWEEELPFRVPAAPASPPRIHPGGPREGHPLADAPATPVAPLRRLVPPTPRYKTFADHELQELCAQYGIRFKGLSKGRVLQQLVAIWRFQRGDSPSVGPPAPGAPADQPTNASPPEAATEPAAASLPAPPDSSPPFDQPLDQPLDQPSFGSGQSLSSSLISSVFDDYDDFFMDGDPVRLSPPPRRSPRSSLKPSPSSEPSSRSPSSSTSLAAAPPSPAPSTTTLPQATDDMLHYLLRNSPDIYNQIITFKPLEFAVVHDLVRQYVTCTPKQLTQFLDQNGIIFAPASNTGPRTKYPPKPNRRRDPRA